MVRKAKGLPHKAKGTKKGRKYGRNKIKCTHYKLQHRHEKSHVRRICRHMKKYGDETTTTQNALEHYRALLSNLPLPK